MNIKQNLNFNNSEFWALIVQLQNLFLSLYAHIWLINLHCPSLKQQKNCKIKKRKWIFGRKNIFLRIFHKRRIMERGSTREWYYFLFYVIIVPRDLFIQTEVLWEPWLQLFLRGRESRREWESTEKREGNL